MAGQAPPLSPLPWWFPPKTCWFPLHSPFLLPPQGPEVQAERGREAWPQGGWSFDTSCFSSSSEPRARVSGPFPVVNGLRAPAPGPFPRGPQGLHRWPVCPPLPCQPVRAGVPWPCLLVTAGSSHGLAVHASHMTAWVPRACGPLLLRGAQGPLWGHRPGMGPVPPRAGRPSVLPHLKRPAPLRLGRCPLLHHCLTWTPSGPGPG